MRYSAALSRRGVPLETVKMFFAWCERHPEVWKEFERLSLEAIGKGVRRWGAKGVVEVMRYKSFGTVPKRKFKINNNYPTYMAMVFVEKYPQHRTFFKFSKVRGLKSRHTEFY